MVGTEKKRPSSCDAETLRRQLQLDYINRTTTPKRPMKVPPTALAASLPAPEPVGVGEPAPLVPLDPAPVLVPVGVTVTEIVEGLTEAVVPRETVAAPTSTVK